jgi:hypothetical protein
MKKKDLNIGLKDLKEVFQKKVKLYSGIVELLEI